MATIKVKFRKSTIVNKPGTIYYQICHSGNNKQITTKIHILPEQWDKEKEQIISKYKNDHGLQMYMLKIENDLSLLHHIIDELERQGDEYFLSDIIDMFSSSSSQVTVLYYMMKQIEYLKKTRKLSTAINYRCALKSFSSFLDGEDISFRLMNENLILKYNDWLYLHGIAKNSISFYMRIWRAVYNKAVKEKIVEQTFPFQNVYTGIDRTRKRAVNEDIVMKLLKLDLKKSPPLALSRDLFVFSYCTRGMAFIDIAFLKKENIENGVLSYYRRKTGRLLLIRIEPCIASIIKRYETSTVNTPYVFPILKSENVEESYRHYKVALGYHNRKLKKLAKMTNACIPFSSYVPRHTWASVARNHHIPLSVISAGMGHSSEKTTQIYLTSLENSVIDDANQNLLSKLNSILSF